MRLGLLLLAALPVLGEDDASGILQCFLLAQKQNDERARHYTFVEVTERLAVDDKGRIRNKRSETHEVIFLEGFQYKKLVARNDRSLSAREQVQVDKQMSDTAEDRRRRGHPAPGGRISFGGHGTDMGSNEEFLTLFDSRLLGTEEVNRRKAWVIELLPASRPAASEHEREVLNYRKKLWIDQEDGVIVKRTDTLVAELPFASAGTNLRIEFDKVSGGVWQPVTIQLDQHKRVGKSVRLINSTVYRNSKFRKFDVQSTISPASPN